MTPLEIQTPAGPARVHLDEAAPERAVLMLGHGAGGGVLAPDLLAVAGAAHRLGLTVARVEQPYRVAGRRSPAPASQLDRAWVAVAERLSATRPDAPLVAGGRSSGARVACRTAGVCGVVGVLCLAFPLRPPPRRDGTPAPSRLGELDAVDVPMLVVQGAADAFGMPPAGPAREVVVVPGGHALRSGVDAIAAAAAGWLARLLA